MKKIMLALILMMPFCVMNTAANESTYSIIAPQKEEFVWRYKNINGHLYKRLWNQTLNKWAGDHWIRC